MTSRLLVPMEPVLVNKPFDDPNFIFQVKWDGVRMLASQTTQGVVLWNRKGRIKTSIYPDIASEVASLQLPAGTILDGEMVSLGEAGRPEFRRVLRRDLASRYRPEIEVIFVVFDYIRSDESAKPVTSDPLELRLEALRKTVSRTAHIQVTDDFSSGTALFARMEALEMEGIVAKRLGSPYMPGRKDPAWQKVKCWRFLEVDAVGVKFRDGRPVSLMIAERNSGAGEDKPGSVSEPWGSGVRSKVIGHVGSGLSAALWPRILSYLTAASPKGPAEQIVPLQQGVQVTVRFLEWTETGQLRSPIVESLQFGEG